MPRPKNGHVPAGLIRAAIYRRTSTERQGERVSPEAQLAECQAHAKTQGYTVTAVYTDTERYRSRGKMVEPSGTRLDRPDFQRMLTDARAGLFDVIIAWKEDRLYRGVKPAVLVGDLLEETPVRVELVKETFDHRMLYIKAAIGRLEMQSIHERTEMGRHERVARGLHHGGRVPRGYTAVKGHGGRTVGYVINPTWRPFFDQLARLFLERRSYDDIGVCLGLNPATGRRWLPGSVRHLVENSFYRGRIEAGYTVKGREVEVFPGLHEPMWDVPTCAALERELTRRHALAHSAPRSRDNLFSGLARCGLCGAPLASNTGVHHGPRGTSRYRSYGCWRSTYIRRGRREGREHAANFISERKLFRQVKRLVASLTVADVDEFLAGVTLAGDAGPLTDLDALRASLAAAEAKLADLAVGLEGVRHASPAATDAIITELRRTGQHADFLRGEVTQASRAAATAPDLDSARLEMLACIADPSRLDRLPLEDLRTALQHMFPLGLFVAHGVIAPPVPAWK